MRPSCNLQRIAISRIITEIRGEFFQCVIWSMDMHHDPGDLDLNVPGRGILSSYLLEFLFRCLKIPNGNICFGELEAGLEIVLVFFQGIPEKNNCTARIVTLELFYPIIYKLFFRLMLVRASTTKKEEQCHEQYAYSTHMRSVSFCTRISPTTLTFTRCKIS